MEARSEKQFNKYKERGNQNWREMMSRDPRRFNAYQQARYEWILKIAGEVKGRRVLDAGSGGGALSYLLAKEGALVEGVEYDEIAVEYARKNIASADKTGRLRCAFMKGSVYELPFAAGTFDAVVSCEVIEHLKEPERMLAEIARVLKPGGIFVLTTPYRLTEIPQDENHVKEYFPGEIRTMLMKYFKEVEVKETHPLFWRSLYVHSFRWAGNRPLGKWVINALALWFGLNPFMVDYHKGKFDLFAGICVWGHRQ